MSTAPSPQVQRVVAETTYELVPLKNLDEQLIELPHGAKVSMTCSPAKGIDYTLELSEKLTTLGLRVTPHIAARLIRDRSQIREIADRLRSAGYEELFLIAGDPEEPAGPYNGALDALRDLLEEDHGLKRIGFSGYPDGHAFIPAESLRGALVGKQAALNEAGVDGWISTQMCFDGKAIASWLTAERSAGLTLPIRLGIPGPIDRTKLLTLGARIGVGQSLKFLKKNATSIRKLMTSTSYDPESLLNTLGPKLDTLDVNGLHLFTFNQLGPCVAWQKEIVG